MGGRCNAGCGGIFSNSGCGNCGCGTVTTDAPKDSAPVEDDAAPSKDPVVPVPVEEKGASNGISIDPSSFVFKG
jgi:hypothetical protein